MYDFAQCCFCVGQLVVVMSDLWLSPLSPSLSLCLSFSLSLPPPPPFVSYHLSSLSPTLIFSLPLSFPHLHTVDMRRLQDYYELGETIGNGGFGAVYAGTSLISGNPVSIETECPLSLSPSPTFPVVWSYEHMLGVLLLETRVCMCAHVRACAWKWVRVWVNGWECVHVHLCMHPILVWLVVPD